eukprot:3309394-Amphidinium_carterae.1
MPIAIALSSGRLATLPTLDPIKWASCCETSAGIELTQSAVMVRIAAMLISAITWYHISTAWTPLTDLDWFALAVL